MLISYNYNSWLGYRVTVTNIDVSVTGITHYMFIGTLSGCFHEDITEQLKGTTKAAEVGCDDLDQSTMDRTITVAFTDEETTNTL